MFVLVLIIGLVLVCGQASAADSISVALPTAVLGGTLLDAGALGNACSGDSLRWLGAWFGPRNALHRVVLCQMVAVVGHSCGALTVELVLCM